ncbi:MAG: hypothetical protein ACK5MH_09130 [Bacteroidales bacterium]
MKKNINTIENYNNFDFSKYNLLELKDIMGDILDDKINPPEEFVSLLFIQIQFLREKEEELKEETEVEVEVEVEVEEKTELEERIENIISFLENKFALRFKEANLLFDFEWYLKKIKSYGIGDFDEDEYEKYWSEDEGWMPKTVFYHASEFYFDEGIEAVLLAREFREIEPIHDFSSLAIKVDGFGVSIKYGTQRYMLRFKENEQPCGYYDYMDNIKYKGMKTKQELLELGFHEENFKPEITERVLHTAFEMMYVEVLNKERRILNKTIKKQMIYDENFLQFIFKTEKYKYTIPLSVVLQDYNN